MTWTPAGKFRFPVKIVLPTETGRADSGQPVNTDVTIPGGECQASIEPMSGATVYHATQLQSGTTHIVKVRYLPNVTSECKVLYRDRRFNISAVFDYQERNIELHLMCQEKLA